MTTRLAVPFRRFRSGLPGKALAVLRRWGWLAGCLAAVSAQATVTGVVLGESGSNFVIFEGAGWRAYGDAQMITALNSVSESGHAPAVVALGATLSNWVVVWGSNGYSARGDDQMLASLKSINAAKETINTVSLGGTLTSWAITYGNGGWSVRTTDSQLLDQLHAISNANYAVNNIVLTDVATTWFVRYGSTGWAARGPSRFIDDLNAISDAGQSVNSVVFSRDGQRWVIFYGAGGYRSYTSTAMSSQLSVISGQGYTVTGAAIGSTDDSFAILYGNGGYYVSGPTTLVDAFKAASATLPAITAQPASQTVNTGQTATFTVTATGSPAPTYQWHRNGTPISGATGATLTLKNVRTANAGNYTVVVSNSAGAVTSVTAVLTVKAVNHAPTVIHPPDQTIDEDAATGAIAVKIADAETAASALKLTATSSNSTLLPASGITLGGSGANRTIKLKPAANANGTVTLTLKVSDGTLSATTTFKLTVKAVNDRPTIGAIANLTTNKNTATKAIAFKIADAETAAAKLKLTRTSSNLKLLPTANIVFGGSGTNRTVTLKPASNQTGSVKVTITVSDGQLSANRTFTLTVNAPPTISKIANQTVAKNKSTAALKFKVGDAETAVAKLKVTAVSSNAALVAGKGIVLAGATANRTVKITPAANKTGSAKITLTVSDGAGTATTSFTVTVTSSAKKTDIASPPAPPVVTEEPASQVVKRGAPVTLTVASAAATTYRWTHDGHAIAGATAATLTLPTVTLTDAGGYAATVTNAAGSTTSATAELTVVDASLATTRAGSILAVSQILTVAGASDGVTLSVPLPAGWTYTAGETAGAKTAPQAGDTSLLEWTWVGAPEKPRTFTYVLDVPANLAIPDHLGALIEVSTAVGTTKLRLELPGN